MPYCVLVLLVCCYLGDGVVRSKVFVVLGSMAVILFNLNFFSSSFMEIGTSLGSHAWVFILELKMQVYQDAEEENDLGIELWEKC